MTREEIMQAYDVNAYGVITSPGRFEGEAAYVPAFYDAVLDGAADTLDWPDGTVTDIISINDADRAEWPEIAADTVAITVEVEDSGFVYAAELTRFGLSELEAENEAAWEASGESADPGLAD